MKDVDAIMEGIGPRYSPGASLLIARGDEVLHHCGYGQSDIDRARPADPDSAYLIASITKQFVCVAALLLVQEGKFQLDRPIGRYAANLPDYKNRVTPRHLMTHTSGIPDYFNDAFRDKYCAENSPNLNQAQLLAHISGHHFTLEFEPGTDWAYSNSAYVILGHLIEQAGNKALADLLWDKIFQPLEMHHTRVGTSPHRPPGMALGYDRKAGYGFENTPYNRTVVGWADGNIISTCGDLFKWQRAWQAGKFFPPALWDEVFTPVKLPSGRSGNYGLGWFIWIRRGLREYWHTGGTVGYQGRISYFPDCDVNIILLMNSSPDNSGDKNIPFGRIVHTILENRLTSLPPWRPLPKEETATWTGKWGALDPKDKDSTGFAIRVDSKNRLRLAGTMRGNQGEWPLLRQTTDMLWVDSGADYFLTTCPSTNGSSTLTLHCHGRKIHLKRYVSKD